MIDSVTNGLATIPPITLVILGILILAILYSLPRILRSSGIKKFGPLEIEHADQTINHNLLRQIDAIDTDNRETLWDMTEDIFLMVAVNSSVQCSAAVGHIIDGVASPIRNMVLLNHIAPKLGKSNEDILKSKLTYGVTRALRDAKLYKQIQGCPVSDEISKLDPSKYSAVIDTWIDNARSITAHACVKKIHLYEHTLSQVHNKHWRDVYETCIEKNKQYITDMGYGVNKAGELYTL